MLGIIKNLLKLKDRNESDSKVNYNGEISDNLSRTDDYIQRIVDAYFTSLEYVKYNIRPLDVDYFCKEIEMSEEDTAKVHRSIKERIVKIRMKAIEGDFS